MKTLKLINSICITALITTAACSPKAGTPAKAALDSIKKTQEDIQRMQDEATQTAENAKRNATNTNETVLNITALGGQPGSIVLSGDIAEELQSPSGRVTVKLETGLSWKKEKAPLSENALIQNTTVSEEKIKEMEKTQELGNEIQLGCGGADFIIEDASKPQILTAKTVVICDLSAYKNTTFDISADTVILRDSKIISEGVVVQWFSLSAQELVLEGQNTIFSVSPDSSFTGLSGPGINITALRVRGSGSLSISSQGANYHP